MESGVKKKLEAFQKLIEYNFKNSSLLLQALTTPQYGNEKQVSNYQILETLGDALIKLLISIKLYEEGEEDPGNLTKVKQRLEDNRTFIKIGKEMKLKNYIFSSVNQKIEGTTILADVFEAICGAIYLDSGKSLNIVEKKIVDRFLFERKELIEDSPHLNKNQLLEFLQNQFKFTPKVKFEYERLGPDNDLRWIAKNPEILDDKKNKIITLPNNLKSKEFKSKKAAEKELSLIILNYLKKE